MFRINRKISHRLFCALFFVAVIPICILGYETYREAEATLIQAAHMHIHTIAQKQAENLDTWFQERLSDAHVLSELSAVRDLVNSLAPGSTGAHVRTGVVDNILALTRGKSSSYESIHILGLSGSILASTEPDSEMLSSLKYLEDLEALKAAGGPTLAPVHQHSNKQWYVHLLVPVLNESGKMQAAIMAILDAPGTLNPIMTNRAGLGKTGEAYLVNEHGQIITETKYLGQEEGTDPSFDTLGIRSALEHKAGTAIYRNYIGREVVGSYLWLSRYHWGLVVEIQKDEILEPIRHIRITVIASTVLVGLLCLLIALFTSRRISKPIIEMAEASREMARGRLEHRIVYSGADEIGVLSSSFNSMADELSAVIHSLRRNEVSLRRAYDELVQAKERLVQSEKMAAVGELVAGVVHEMRNPLSSVKLNFQILGRALEEDDELAEHYLIGIDQIAQLERMFSSLLDYSKPISLHIRPFAIDEVITGSIRQLEAHPRHRNVRFADRSGPLPPVLGDPDQIGQVLVNIIRNAMEATQDGADIEISARTVESEGKSAVVVQVADHGPGIPESDLKRIFQPFFTTKEKGTGLGLSIVKKIMDAHCFGISMDSGEGRGTVVSLHF